MQSKLKFSMIVNPYFIVLNVVHLSLLFQNLSEPLRIQHCLPCLYCMFLIFIGLTLFLHKAVIVFVIPFRHLSFQKCLSAHIVLTGLTYLILCIFQVIVYVFLSLWRSSWSSMLLGVYRYRYSIHLVLCVEPSVIDFRLPCSIHSFSCRLFHSVYSPLWAFSLEAAPLEQGRMLESIAGDLTRHFTGQKPYHRKKYVNLVPLQVWHAVLSATYSFDAFTFLYGVWLIPFCSCFPFPFVFAYISCFPRHTLCGIIFCTLVLCSVATLSFTVWKSRSVFTSYGLFRCRLSRYMLSFCVLSGQALSHCGPYADDLQVLGLFADTVGAVVLPTLFSRFPALNAFSSFFSRCTFLFSPHINRRLLRSVELRVWYIRYVLLQLVLCLEFYIL